MDNIILGLLFMCNRTIYQLRDRINKGIHLMYSSSMGSIQAAVKKLLNCGYISYEEMIDNGKYKKVYSITESGKQHFLEWVNNPIEKQIPKNPELAKVYFMGFSDKKNRETSIQEHLVFLNKQYNLLETICEDGNNIDVPKEHKDILNYQFVSALYGKDLIKFNIDWFENLLRKMRNGEI
ncbi:MAG: PadR family transcriptional regulator [Oscillospiraceae bacterium]